jgi:hypothetical protein
VLPPTRHTQQTLTTLTSERAAGIAASSKAATQQLSGAMQQLAAGQAQLSEAVQASHSADEGTVSKVAAAAASVAEELTGAWGWDSLGGALAHRPHSLTHSRTHMHTTHRQRRTARVPAGRRCGRHCGGGWHAPRGGAAQPAPGQGRGCARRGAGGAAVLPARARAAGALQGAAAGGHRGASECTDGGRGAAV